MNLYNFSDTVAGTVEVKHNNYSSAHAHALIVNFMLPYYIEIGSPIWLEGPALCSEVSNEGVKFHVSSRDTNQIAVVWENFDPYRIS